MAELSDRAMVMLAGSTGIRRSELIVLTWADLNTSTLEVNVTRSCVGSSGSCYVWHCIEQCSVECYLLP
jgi:site-specific recombinase XerC